MLVERCIAGWSGNLYHTVVQRRLKAGVSLPRDGVFDLVQGVPQGNFGDSGERTASVPGGAGAGGALYRRLEGDRVRGDAGRGRELLSSSLMMFSAEVRSI